MSALFELYPDQQHGLDLLRGSIRNSLSLARPVRTVIQAPTGWGKTVVAAHILSGSTAHRQRAAFLVPMISLIDQSFTRFQANGIEAGDMGIIQGNHPWRRPHAPLQICSVQTLGSRGFPEVRRVLVDECHLMHKSVLKWMDANPEVHFIGLSATPWAKGMGNHWNDLVIPITLGELIEKGRLSPFKMFVGSRPNLDRVKVVAGEYQQDQLSDLMSERTIVGDVVSNWIQNGQGRPTLCFAVDRAHAATLHDQFSECGVASEYVDGESSREEREAILVRLRRGETKVICSVGTMTTGIDEDVRCLIMARPTKSKILYIQMFGRGLRTAEGKDYCLVFDHAGVHKLGLPTDIHYERLRTSKIDAEEKKAKAEGKEKTAAQPRECGSCHELIPAATRACPSCGHVNHRPNTVMSVDGVMHEYGTTPPATLDALGVKPDSARAYLIGMGKQAIFSQLRAMQAHRADGWVSHKYRAIFDVWPQGLDKTRPIDPTPELQMWVRSQNIAFSKSAAARISSSSEDSRLLAAAQ